jgi:hypothetical protein
LVWRGQEFGRRPGVHDDWSITGVTDWNSEAGQQLSRIAGLWSTLYTAELKWGLKLSHAHFLISTIGSDTALKNEVSEMKKIKSEDPSHAVCIHRFPAHARLV